MICKYTCKFDESVKFVKEDLIKFGDFILMMHRKFDF